MVAGVRSGHGRRRRRPGPTSHAGRGRGRARDAFRDQGRVERGRRTVRAVAGGGCGPHPLRRDEPVRRGGRTHWRPARALPARDPPAVRRWPRHALAVEPRGRRGGRRRLQPPDARPRATPDRGHGRSGPLGPRRCARYAGRVRRHGRPRVHRSGVTALAPGPGLLSPTGRFVLFEGHPVEWLFDVDADGRWIATDYDYFAGPEASRGWAPEYIDHLSIPDAAQSLKFARAWTLGEVITSLLRADLRLERVAEHPIDWWGGHADVRPEDRGRVPLSFSVVGRRS